MLHMNWQYSTDEEAVYAYLLPLLPPSLENVLSKTQAVHKHDQRLQEGQLVHVYRCALILIEALNISDYDLIAAMLLHDTVEDTEMTLDDVQNLTNARVRELVDACTSPSETIDNAQFLDKIKHADRDGQLIKLVDRLDNCRSMQKIAQSHPDFVKKYAQVTVDFFLPLAKNISEYLYSSLRTEVDKVLGGPNEQTRIH